MCSFAATKDMFQTAQTGKRFFGLVSVLVTVLKIFQIEPKPDGFCGFGFPVFRLNGSNCFITSSGVHVGDQFFTAEGRGGTVGTV